MKTIFERPTLTEEEKHYYRSMIFKESGRPNDPNHKENNAKATIKYWKESPIKDDTIEYFRSLIYTHPHPNGTKKLNKEKKMNNNDVTDDEQKKIVFARLIRWIIKKCGRTPDDDMCDALVGGLGFSGALWWNTKNNLETKEGYVFTSIPNGYKVEIPNPHKEEMEGIKRDLNRLTLRLQQLEKQNS